MLNRIPSYRRVPGPAKESALAQDWNGSCSFLSSYCGNTTNSHGDHAIQWGGECSAGTQEQSSAWSVASSPWNNYNYSYDAIIPMGHAADCGSNSAKIDAKLDRENRDQTQTSTSKPKLSNSKLSSASLAFVLSQTLRGPLTPNTQTFRSRGSWATKLVANNTIWLSYKQVNCRQYLRFCRFQVNSISRNVLKVSISKHQRIWLVLSSWKTQMTTFRTPKTN